VATEDPKVQQDTPPEPELAPYLIESARSSRSKCRTCRRKIEKGKLRLGILLEGPFGTGYLWHHLTCAAKRRIDDVEAAYAQPAFEDGLEVPPLSELQALMEKAEKAREARKEPPYVERAPSGRSKCKHCGEAIAKDALRVVLAREVSFGSQVRAAPIAVHTECVSEELGSEDCLTEPDGFEEKLRQNSEIESSAVDEALAAIGDLEG
jgi:ribosomal protein L37AE/L43A